MFRPARLTLARERRCVTKLALAEAVEIAARNIHRYEDGELRPTQDTLARIAQFLDFPQSFFVRPPPPEFAERVSFRSLSTLTKKKQAAVLAAGTIAVELSAFLDSHLRLPDPNLPGCRGQDAEGAVAVLRAHWGLGNKPITNMVQLLEKNGVRVFSLVGDQKEVDAFTVRHDEVPFVFLNTLKSAERGRFDAAHELGHLVLHEHGSWTGKEVEREADAFASAFLMPRADVIAHHSPLPKLDNLIEKKQRFGVSVGAYARRLRDLELIATWHYKDLCVQISKRGYRKHEPKGRRRETSQLLLKAFTLLKEKKGITRPQVAAELGITNDELSRLLFGLTLSSIEGSSRAGTSSWVTTPPQLRRVK